MEIPVSHPRLKTKLIFSKSDLNYLKLLEEDEYLEEFIYKLRRSVSIPEKGINLDTDNFSAILPTDDLSLKKLWKASYGLLWYLNLPSRWQSTTLSLLLFGVATPPDAQGYKPVTFTYVSNRFNIDETPEILITIREKISREQVKMIIDENKKEIDKLLSSLPKNPTAGKIKNIEISKIIRHLKKSKGLTDKEIGKEIEAKLGNDYPTDYSSIRQLRNRFEKYFRTHIKSDRMR